MGAHVSKNSINTNKHIDFDQECQDLYFINYKNFKAFGKFPRYSDTDKNLSLISLDDIPYSDSIIIFISHCWLRTSSKENHIKNNYNLNINHPDTINNEKYKLCIDGIDKILQNQASGMEHCYIWLDYTCINQDSNTDDKDMMKLHVIMYYCDCIFTPIYEEKFLNNWKLPTNIIDLYEEYKASSWIDGDDAYLNRAWCRMEMLLASNIPLKSYNDRKDRLNKYSNGLKYNLEYNRRPHYIYGTYDQYHGHPPRILNPLLNIPGYLEKYNPLNGKLKNDQDIKYIREYLNILKLYIKPKPLGYTGEYNPDTGEKHGEKCIYIYEDGSEFIGEYQYNNKNGKGLHFYSNGNIYDGNYIDNKRSGYGLYIYCNGDSYIGEWQDNQKHGQGKFIYADIKCSYDGQWKNDLRDGYGILITPEDEYMGFFHNNQRNNKGILRCKKSGDIYDGMFLNDTYHGKGVLKTLDAIYEGEFIHGIFQQRK